jgi:hypothetical protein
VFSMENVAIDVSGKLLIAFEILDGLAFEHSNLSD